MIERLFTETIARQAMIHLAVSVVLWVLVIVACLLDLWDAVYTARRLHERVRSRRLRVTIGKISEYWRLMLIGFMIDTIGILLPFYALPYLSMVLCVGLIGVEAKSMFEHAKRRRSRTVELTDLISMAINCSTEQSAKEALKRFSQYLDAAASAPPPASIAPPTVLGAFPPGKSPTASPSAPTVPAASPAG